MVSRVQWCSEYEVFVYTMVHMSVNVDTPKVCCNRAHAAIEMGYESLKVTRFMYKSLRM